jgi:hypothetical protein
MFNGLIRPADPVQRKANRLANLGDELKAARQWVDTAKDATDHANARKELLRVQRAIAKLN